MRTKSIFRATAILSSSSIISIFLSLIVAKILALYLQPEGFGFYGLLQSFVSVASLVAGMGVATGIVRMGAASAAREDFSAMAVLTKGCWILFVILGGLSTCLIAICRKQLSIIVLGDSGHGPTMLLMSVALLFTVASNIQVGTLNAHHRVAALAKYGIVNTVLSSSMSIASVLLWRRHGIVPAVIASSVGGWIASRYFLSREVGPQAVVKPQWRDAFASARELLRFGAPFTGSMFVGTGVQLLLPIIVLHLLNPQSVGYYRAAAGISVGYLGFLITAMGQDYYPRVSAAADNPTELVRLINAQHRLVMLVAVPVILFTLAVVPYAVPLVYSAQFKPTVAILEWQLMGDIFKFASWTMSFAILARCTSSVYFVVELLGGFVTLLTTWFGVKWFGLSGLGTSFLCTYVIYYVMVWIVIRREVPLVWSGANKKMLIAAVIAASIVRVLPYTSLAPYRTYIAIGLTLFAAVPSLWIVRREFKASPTHFGEVSPTPVETEQIASA